MNERRNVSMAVFEIGFVVLVLSVLAALVVPTVMRKIKERRTIEATENLRVLFNASVEYYQRQLDEIARGLIAAFAESDQSAVPTLPDAPGLFTWPGAPALPAGGTVSAGLAGRITLHADVDPAQGGNAELLRDGITTNYNTGGDASFTGRLMTLMDELETPRTLVGNGGVSANQTLLNYSTGSVSWIEDARKSAAYGEETKFALMFRTTEALSNITHVNVDEEMALMLQLEQSYAASAKMMQMIDEMLKTLLSVVR